MKRQRQYWQIITFLIMITILNGCRASKQIVVPAGETSLSKQQFLKAYHALQDCPVMDGNGKLTVVTEGKTDISLGNIGFRWSLKRDNAFVFSIRPVSIMEVGRLTISDGRLLLLDRMGKRAVLEEQMGNSSILLKDVVGIDTNIFKAMVQNEPFGLIGVGSDALQRMRFKKDQKHYIFTDALRPGGHQITHLFDAALNLVESQVTIANKGNIKISYWDFIHITQNKKYRPVPTVIRLDIELETQPAESYRMQIKLDRIKQAFTQEVNTNIPSGYHRVTLDDLMDIISSL